LGGSKESDADVTKKLNQLTDEFILAAQAQEVDEVMGLTSYDMWFDAYFGQERLEGWISSMVEEDLEQELSELGRDEFLANYDEIPFLLERAEALYDAYESKGLDDPEVQELMYELAWDTLKMAVVGFLTFDMGDDSEESLEEFFAWVEASTWYEGGLVMPRDAFARFVSVFFEDESIEVRVGEPGPFKDGAKWYVELIFSQGDSGSDDDELLRSILGFAKVGSKWKIELFQLDLSEFLPA
jgi:hypothetical protein